MAIAIEVPRHYGPKHFLSVTSYELKQGFRRQLRPPREVLDFGVELVKDGAKSARQRVGVREQRGPVRSEDPKIELGVEERDFETVAGDRVAMRLRDAMNEPLQTQ